MSNVEVQEPAPANARTDVAMRPDRIAAIRAAIDIRDRISLGRFGERAQRAATAFADRILAASAGEREGDPSVVLGAMLAKAKELDAASVRPRTGFIGRLLDNQKARIGKFRAQYSDVASAIDEMAVTIERHKEDLRSDAMVLESLYGETIVSIRDLDEHIEAGRLAAAEASSQVSALKARAEAAGVDRTIALQEAMDAEQAADRLEKRSMQLHQARQIALQQLPQIRIMQSGNETLMQNLDSALTLTIPAWKQKMVVVLGLARQGQALATDKALSDATGRMMKETAALVRQQAYEIEDRSQQGLVDVAAIEETNAILIDAISGILKKQSDGRATRREAVAKIGVMRRDLEAVIARQ